jgi:hypothetical protein
MSASLLDRMRELATVIAGDMKALKQSMGTNSQLQTSARSSLVAAINELAANQGGGSGLITASIFSNTLIVGPTAISGHRAICVDSDGKAIYADSSIADHANAVAGISTHAALTGQPLTVQSAGVLEEPSWTWMPHQPVFLGVNGFLTQTPPSVGFQLIVGVPKSATELLIGVKAPIVLG